MGWVALMYDKRLLTLHVSLVDGPIRYRAFANPGTLVIADELREAHPSDVGAGRELVSFYYPNNTGHVEGTLSCYQGTGWLVDVSYVTLSGRKSRFVERFGPDRKAEAALEFTRYLTRYLYVTTGSVLSVIDNTPYLPDDDEIDRLPSAVSIEGTEAHARLAMKMKKPGTGEGDDDA